MMMNLWLINSSTSHPLRFGNAPLPVANLPTEAHEFTEGVSSQPLAYLIHEPWGLTGISRSLLVQRCFPILLRKTLNSWFDGGPSLTTVCCS